MSRENVESLYDIIQDFIAQNDIEIIELLGLFEMIKLEQQLMGRNLPIESCLNEFKCDICTHKWEEAPEGDFVICPNCKNKMSLIT